MRVLVVAPYYESAARRGGPAKSIAAMCRGLAEADTEVTVVTPAEGMHPGEAAPQLAEGVHLIRASMVGSRLPGLKSYFFSPALMPRLRAALSRADITLIQGLWTFPANVGSLWAILRRVPFVITPRGNLESCSLAEKKAKKAIALALVVHSILKRADAIHFTSEAELQRSQSAIRRQRSFVVENGFIFAPLASDFTEIAPCRGLRLGMVGRIHPRKGFDVILPALQGLPKQVQLDIIGPDEGGHRRKITEMARDCGVLQRVRFRGMLSGERLIRAYQGLDYLVVPSHGESFGNTVIESLSLGIPVIATPLVPMWRLLQDNHLGLVTDNTAPAWNALLRDVSQTRLCWDRKRLASAVRAEFDYKVKGAQLKRELSSLLQDRQGESQGRTTRQSRACPVKESRI